MKTINLVVGLLLFTNLLVNAQNENFVKKTFHLDNNSVVKDSAGNTLPYNVWHPKLMSGNYILKPLDNSGNGPTYFIYRISNQTKNYPKSIDLNENRVSINIPPQNSNLSNINEPVPPMPPESPSFKIGKSLTSFNANDIKGNRIKLKELQGKIVVLNFWFIGCPPCMQEIPEFNKIVEKYANNPNVIFVAIGLDDKYDIKEFLKTKPYNFQIIADGRMYADLYHVTLYPTTVILDKEGKVCFDTVSFGPGSPFWITKTIDGLL